MGHTDPFFVQVGQKMTIFRGFNNFYFRTNGLQLKLLILIESLNIFHWKTAKKTQQSGCGLGAKSGPIYLKCCEKRKETGIINRFYSYFAWGTNFKARSTGCTNTCVEII